MSIIKMITFISWATVILWLLIVFSLSSQPGPKSNDLSKSLTKQIIKATQKVVVRIIILNREGM